MLGLTFDDPMDPAAKSLRIVLGYTADTLNPDKRAVSLTYENVITKVFNEGLHEDKVYAESKAECYRTEEETALYSAVQVNNPFVKMIAETRTREVASKYGIYSIWIQSRRLKGTR